MTWLVMRCEEIAPDHIEIAIVNMTLIFDDQTITVYPIPRRNIIPRHGGFSMMGGV